MPTYNEIGFDILELLKGNQISDDVDISMEHILYHVNNQRALFLRNEFNKSGRKLDAHLIQDLGCLEITEVDAAECCSVSTGCVVLRTVKKVPPFIELHNGPAITYVGPVKKLSQPFPLVAQAKVPYIGANKYTRNDIHATLLNDYIYLIIHDPTLQGIEYINVRGIVANPNDLLEFKSDTAGTPCFSYDDEYPINNWMLPYLKQQILAQFGMSLQAPKDDDNNAKDNMSQA